jgi:hypothetical protein
MNKSVRKLVFVMAVLGMISTLGGCASPANREAMQAAPVASLHKSEHSVAVRTSGGADTGAMDSTNIADADFKSAIESSITQSGVFKTVIQGSGADYDLSVSVVRLSKPLAGFSMTVTMEDAWSLIRASDKSVVWRKPITSTFTAGMGDAFAGVTRLRMAVEGAARANIAQGLKEISDLKL